MLRSKTRRMIHIGDMISDFIAYSVSKVGKHWVFYATVLMYKAITIILAVCLSGAAAKAVPPGRSLSILETKRSLNLQGYIGAGFGIPYGVVGINTEVALNAETRENLYLTGGIGILFTQGLAYSGGLNFYLLDYDRWWRPRMSVLYGTNSYYQSRYENYVYQGLNVGVGQLIQIGTDRNVAISLDAIVIVNSGLYDKLEELNIENEPFTMLGFSRVKFAVGVKWAF